MSQEYFSISEGGPFHNALVKMRLNNNPVKLIIVFLSITWFPLFIITAVEGTLSGSIQLPFLKDVAMQFRLLITLPLLLLIGKMIDNKAIDMQKYFSETLMNDNEQQSSLSKILTTTKKLANSTLMEIILLLIVIVITINIGTGGLWNNLYNESGSWRDALNDTEHINSFSGIWAGYFSVPVFQFLLLRWLWRYIIWILFLLQLSRCRLTLKVTHPDKAGGLGIVLHTQKFFSFLFVAFCIVASGELMAQLIRDPGSFSAIRSEAIGYIVLCIILLLLPIIFFTGKLIKTKHKGLLKFSNLGTSLGGKFESEWIKDVTIEAKLVQSSVSTSTLQDYSTIYKSLQQIDSFPVSVKDILFFATIFFIPFIPLLFIHFSVGELFQKLVGLLL